MRTKDTTCLILLVIFGAFIWLRDTSWMTASAEVVPILAAFPLFVWLGAPWNLSGSDFSIQLPSIVIATACLMFGIAFDTTFLLAVAWTATMWGWLSPRLNAERRACVLRLLILPIMSFPWLMLEGDQVGWWFRLSAAWVTEQASHALGLNVNREGTHLVVLGLPIVVDASCSGLKVLQAMLIAGSAVAFIQLGQTRHYWWFLVLLILAAWIANTMRVMVLSAAALTFGQDFAAGWFHTWGGWSVLVVMFLLSWGGGEFWRHLIGVKKTASSISEAP